MSIVCEVKYIRADAPEAVKSASIVNTCTFILL